MKQSKKRWSWTEKQIRKTTKGSNWRRTAPTWFCKFENKAFKTKTTQSLNKVMLGYDTDFLEFGRTKHHHSAGWNWW